MGQMSDTTIDFRQSINRLSEHRKPKAGLNSHFGEDLLLLAKSFERVQILCVMA